jgi:hypothetical protein
VVFGTVTRYRDRVPGPPIEPASVAYEAVLVRAVDGVLLAADRFDDTQQNGGSCAAARARRVEIVDGALDGGEPPRRGDERTRCPYARQDAVMRRIGLLTSGATRPG